MEYNFADLSKDSLEIIRDAERKIAATKGQDVTLVAYRAEG